MRTAVALLIAAGGLAACAPLDQPLSPSLGQAVAAMDRQIVPPTAAPADAIPESSGARGVEAIRRYEAGAIKPPVQAATSDVAAQAPSDSGATSGVAK